MRLVKEGLCNIASPVQYGEESSRFGGGFSAVVCHDRNDLSRSGVHSLAHLAALRVRDTACTIVAGDYRRAAEASGDGGRLGERCQAPGAE